jgi:photosystem II stability/assembly factor-like uncharacterized protein
MVTVKPQSIYSSSMRFLVLLLTATAFAQWQPQQSGTKENLRGVSIFDRDNIWASGTNGTYLVTKDGGKTWNFSKVPGAESLDFRGVKAFRSEVFLLAAGPGDKSRIYHLRKGKPWELQFTNNEPKGFLDCMALVDTQHGIVLGDPVNGRFQILRTRDGGRTWQNVDSQKMPPAIEGEGAFAASNSCIAVNGTQDLWFATGGPVARVFHSSDAGDTWSVSDIPITHGTASQGIFSIAFRDSLHGMIAGGDYQHPEQGGPNLAITEDGGKTWKLAEVAQQKFFSAVAYVGGTNPGMVAVGSAASGYSKDELRTWATFSPDGFNAVDSEQGVIYAVGANGKIAKFQQ